MNTEARRWLEVYQALVRARCALNHFQEDLEPANAIHRSAECTQFAVSAFLMDDSAVGWVRDRLLLSEGVAESDVRRAEAAIETEFENWLAGSAAVGSGCDARLRLR